MLRKPVLVPFAVALWAFSLALAPGALRASDHADPILLGELDPGLTGLFAFPDGDRLVFILAGHRALSAAPPYDLEPYELAIHMDLHTEVTYTSAEDRARYGGTIPNPETIRPDVTLRFRLNDDATLAQQSFEGLRETNEVRVWTGVRDDPFILPTFFGTNVVAIVVSIPRSAFPEDQRDWILWGATYEADGGDQIDHVGRSNRTQLARFDLLNTLPPSEHVPAIRKAHDRRETAQNLLNDLGTLGRPLANLVNIMFAIRHYDFVPDVMIYTTRYAAGFPNGRRLTDDVALLTCRTGDCLLIETSYMASEAWPRETTNDKPFLAEFPYLAEPWPAKEPADRGFPWGVVLAFLLLLVVLVFVALAVIGLVCILRKRKVRKHSRGPRGPVPATG